MEDNSLSIEVKTEPEGRICKQCGNKLSIYNRDDICFHHSEHPQYAPKDSFDRPAFNPYNARGRFTTISSYEGFFSDE